MLLFDADSPSSFLTGQFVTSLANFFTVYSGFAALIGGLVVYAQSRRKRKHLARLLETEERINKALKLQLSEAEEEKEAAVSQLPLTARDTAEKEVSEGNLDLAPQTLAKWMEQESATISQMLFIRAEWSLGIGLGKLRSKGLCAAHGFAIAAQAFRPNYPEAFLLRREIEELIRLEAEPTSVTAAFVDFDIEVRQMIERLSLEDQEGFTQLVFSEFTHRMNAGQFRSALLVLQTVKEWIGARHGARSAQMIEWHVKRSSCVLVLGRLAESLADSEAALRLCYAYPSSDPTGELRREGLFYHAATLERLGQYVEALNEAEAVRDATSSNLGPEHSDTLTSRYLIAELLQHIGRYEEALKEAKAVFDTRTKSLGPEHRDTLTSRFLIAQILRSLTRYGDALNQANAVLNAQKNSSNLGPEHKDTLNTRHLIAHILECLGRHEEALIEANAVLNAQKNSSNLGPGLKDTVNTRHLIADILLCLGRYEEALTEAKAVFTSQTKSLGPGHPDTLKIRCLIADILKGLGRDEEALIQAKAVLDAQPNSLSPGPGHQYLVTRRCLIPNILKPLALNKEGLNEANSAHRSDEPQWNASEGPSDETPPPPDPNL